MKKLIFSLVLITFIIGCKTGEEAFVWDPTGDWTINIFYVVYGWGQDETFTLTGSATSGTVTGYTVYGAMPPQSGTYAKTGEFALSMDFDFWGYGDHLIFNFIGTSSQAAPNTMSGTGTWNLNGSLYQNLTWSATKTSNLQ